MAWLMLCGSVCVWAYTPSSQTTQTYQLHTVSSATVSSYGSSGGAAASSVTTGSSYSRTAVQPTYQFHSTSALSIPSSTPTFTPLVDAEKENRQGPVVRKLDPDEDEIGNIPVGNPLVLLAFAALYLCFRTFRRKQA